MAIAQEASSAVRLEPAAIAAAERLFQQHSGWIYGYCLRLLRSPEEAEDALQATYLNACRSLKDGFEPRADSAWLLKVAQNVCLTRLRSSGRRARVERPQDADVLEDTVAAPANDADELIGLPDALAGLPAQQRQAILLREWQGLSYREVAEELDLTQSAVETLIFRARRSLAQALENPESPRRRTLHGFDLGGLAAALKSLLGGGALVKVAAIAAVAATATVAAADPVGWHRPSSAASEESKPAAAPTASPRRSHEAVSAEWEGDARAEGRFLAAQESRALALSTGPAARRAHARAKTQSYPAQAKGKALGQGQNEPPATAHGSAQGPSEHANASATREPRGGPPLQAPAGGNAAKQAKPPKKSKGTDPEGDR